MKRIWQLNHCWLPKIDFFVSSTLLMLYPVFLVPKFSVPPPLTQSTERLWVFAWFFDDADKNSLETFWHTQILSICGLEKFWFFRGALWWPITVKLHAFIYLLYLFNSLFQSMLYYLSFIFCYIISSFIDYKIWLKRNVFNNYTPINGKPF